MEIKSFLPLMFLVSNGCSDFYGHENNYLRQERNKPKTGFKGLLRRIAGGGIDEDPRDEPKLSDKLLATLGKEELYISNIGK